MLKIYNELLKKEFDRVKDDAKANPYNYGSMANNDASLLEIAKSNVNREWNGAIDISNISETTIHSTDILNLEEVYSYDEFLNKLLETEHFVNLFVHDFDTMHSMRDYFYKMRKELFTLLDDEYPTRTVRGFDNVPPNSTFIYRDSSNMYADYVYYWNDTEKCIYEERISLGD